MTQGHRNVFRPLAVLLLIFLAAPLQAASLDTRARAAIVIDYETGAVLMQKNADTALPPASMSKLMTMFMVFEALKEGRIGLTTQFRVSEKAWNMGGSKMFVRVGDSVSIENLIRGVIVQSGNDACIVLAEGLAGSEAEFAIRMTQRGREIGLEKSEFHNATGWPHAGHRMSARDLATLATSIIRDYPEYYPYYSERAFTWEGIEQENRNPLLALEMGADGLKTGHTEEAGYGLVGSAVQNGRRVVFVIMGLGSTRARAEEAERIVSWAFREFTPKTLFTRNARVTDADVWLGAANTVGLVAAQDVTALVPFSDRNAAEVRAVFEGPIEAPIAKGQPVGELVVTFPGLTDQSFPLVAEEDVPEGNFLKKMMASGMILGQKVIDAASSNAE